MAGGITKRGQKQWLVRIRRKGRVVTQTFDSYDAAVMFRNKTVSEIDGNRYVDVTRERNTTLVDLLDRYAAEVTPTKKNASREIYALAAWRREPWARLPVSAISAPDHVIPWRNKRVNDGAAPSTVSNALNTLSAVFGHAINEWGLNITNPVRGIKRPKPRPPRRVKMSSMDRTALLTACAEGPPWLLHLAHLALETAARQGELLSIRWENVHETHIHLPQTKNGEARDVPLTDEASAVLASLRRSRQHDDFLFGGGNLTRNSVVHHYRRAVSRAIERHQMSRRFTFHDLRHVAITELKQDHVDALDLAKTTGHKTLNVLHRVYYEPDPAERAADIRRRRAERKAREAAS